MSHWIYRKPEATDVQGICVVCFKRKQKRRTNGLYQALCAYCDDKRFGIKRSKRVKCYRKNKLKFCERCGFIAEDPCQLDIHHKDGDHHNNDLGNLETLCANCHRLEHKDFYYRQKESPSD